MNTPVLNNQSFISIVSPVYQAERIIDELVKAIVAEVSLITDNFEIILVEDCSGDNSWAVIVANCLKHPFIKGIKLSRNYGQHSAIASGLHHANGEYIVVMDCDLQDDPAYIKTLLAKAQGGADIVYTIKKERKHSSIKNITAAIFHVIFTYLVGGKQSKSDEKIGAFSLITRKVANAYALLKDDYRPYLVMLNILGFTSAYVYIEHRERFSGTTTSYSFQKLAAHALNGIISQTDRLLKLSIYIGIVYMLCSFVFGAYVFVQALLHGFSTGWASTVLLITFSTGIILLFLGIIGLYISRIFMQVKQRPLYIVDKTINI